MNKDRNDKRTVDLLNWCFTYVFSEENKDSVNKDRNHIS